jgi:hypothetical protein
VNGEGSQRDFEAGSGRAPQPPAVASFETDRARHRRRRWFVVLAGCAVAAALLAAGLELAARSPSACPRTTIPASVGIAGGTFPLEPCGATFSLAAHGYRWFDIPRITDSQQVSGSFSATGAVIAYSMNYGQLRQLAGVANGSLPTSYLWTSGSVEADTMTAPVPPSPSDGYLVFVNPSGAAAISVEFTSGLELEYTSPTG